MPRKEPPPSLADALTSRLVHWFGLSMRVTQGAAMRHQLELQGRLNISSAMMVALHVIAVDGAKTMTELSEQLGLSTSAVSHLLQRLVEIGLIERREDPVDRRVRRVALTAEGQALLSTIMRQRFDDLRASVAPLSEATQRRLEAAIGDVIEELQRHLGVSSWSCPQRNEGLDPHAAAPRTVSASDPEAASVAPRPSLPPSPARPAPRRRHKSSKEIT